MIIIPLPAAAYMVAPDIGQGATIYIGEEGLNLTHALNRAGGLDGAALDSTEPTNWTIGWWISDVAHSSSSYSQNISSAYRNFTVAPGSYVGYTGYWYLEDPDHPQQALLDSSGRPHMVFRISDPRLDIRIWDMDLDMDVTGKSTPRGDALGFWIETNMYGALNDHFRSPVNNSEDEGYINIKVKNESAYTYTELLDNLNTPHSLLRQNVSYAPWIWGDFGNPAASSSWATGAESPESGPVYPVGTYTVMAESQLNNMKANYRQGGADYTGRTVSQATTVTLISDIFQLQLNKNTVTRGERIPVVITGRPKGVYYIWVSDTGSMTGSPGDQPPTILPASMVFQDPDEGPYDAIGGHEILGEGMTISEDVPPSTENISRNAYYAKVVPASYAVILEFRTSASTKPGNYVIRAENDASYDEVTVEVLPEILPAEPEPGGAGRIIDHPLVNPDIPAPVNTDLKRVSRGGTVFIGEGGLDISGAVADARARADPPLPPRTVIGWGLPFYDIKTSPALGTVDLAGRETAFFVSPASFVGYTGTWYLIDPLTGMAAVDNGGEPIPVLTVADPSLDMRVWDTSINNDVTGKTVLQGDRLTFRIDTNMYPALDPLYRPDITADTSGTMNLIVRDPNGARNSYLYVNNTTMHILSDLPVDSQPWFWGSQLSIPTTAGSWDTGLLDRDRYYYYPPGTYTVCAESAINRMKDNYKQGGAYYTGKTVSQCNTITIVTGTGPEVRTIDPGTPHIINTTIAGAYDGDTIILNPGTYYEHDITITGNITIRANTSAGGSPADTIIDAALSGRIFDNSAGKSLTIANLTLRNGYIHGAPTTGDRGGGIISETGSLTILSSVISNCSAPNFGGAISSTGGYLEIISSTLSNNSAGSSGGGIFTSLGNATISRSVFSNCTSGGAGGAIYSDRWNTTVISSTFSDCSAISDAGAIFSFYDNVIIRFSRIIRCNTPHAIDSNHGNVDAADNWWGTNDPSEFIPLYLNLSPWLVLNISATPSSITNAQASTIRTNLTNNSAGDDTTSGGIFVPDGIPVAFTVNGGTGSVLPQNGNITSGANTTTFTPAGAGTSTVSATVDGQIVWLPVAVSSMDTDFNVTRISVDPPGELTSGYPATGTFYINITGKNGETFPSGSELLMGTDLDNARWNYSIILDGVETPQYGFGGRILPISGWVLSYPSSIQESLNVTLEGTAPSVTSPAMRTLVNATEIDSHGDPIPGSRFVRRALVVPPGSGAVEVITFNDDLTITPGTILHIPAGGKVVWVNDDPVHPHGVRAISFQMADYFGGMDTVIIPYDTPFTVTFDNAGRYDYTTVFEPEIPGEIYVSSVPSKIGVFRPSTHLFILKNGSITTTINWGTGSDLPVTGDWNGDGTTEIGVFRPSTHKFYLRPGDWTATPTTTINWGTSTDLPVMGDWNDDGITEVGVFRPSMHKFYLRPGDWPATPTITINWGTSTDTPVTGDWNGDGLWDVGVFRKEIHTFYLKNGSKTTTQNWGTSTDTPVIGDWNGDGLWDVGVFRNATHTFYLKNGSKTTAVNWGLKSDQPVTGKWS